MEIWTASSRVGATIKARGTSVGLVPRVRQDVGEDRQQVRGGLAGPGLRLGDDVAAGQRQRQHLGLDLGEVVEAELRNRSAERLGQVEVVERAFR